MKLMQNNYINRSNIVWLKFGDRVFCINQGHFGLLLLNQSLFHQHNKF